MRWKKLNCSNFRSHFLNFTFSSMFLTFSCVQLYNRHKKILEINRNFKFEQNAIVLFFFLSIFSSFFFFGLKKKWDEIKVKANYDVTLEKAKKCYWCCVWNTYRLLQWSIPSCSQSTHMAKYSNFQYCEKWFNLVILSWNYYYFP